MDESKNERRVLIKPMRFAQLTSLSRSKIYQMIQREEIPVVHPAFSSGSPNGRGPRIR